MYFINLKKIRLFILITLFSLTFQISVPATGLTPQYNHTIITKIVSAILTGDNFKNHFNLTPYTISSELFTNFLEKLDPNHLYYTQKDVDYLKNSVRTNLYEQLEAGDTSFAFRAYNLFVKKVEERTEFAKTILKEKFDFNIDESYTYDRTKISWTKNTKELNEVWRKKIKNELLTYQLMSELATEGKKTDKNTTKTKKKKSSKKVKTPKQKILARLNTYAKYLEKNESMTVLELYLNTFTHLYDPHSSYMSPHSEENFNIQMKLSFVGIGAYLTEEDGYVTVERIIPGGPANKSDNIKAGDKIVGVGNSKKNITNVIDMPTTDVVKKIRGKEGTPVYLTILPAAEGIHGIPKNIKIIRGVVNLKDAEAQEQVVEKKLKNGKELKIGIIDLPSFYYDFKAASEGNKDIKCSTSDVKKILDKLNKENIDGLIIDLRSNGGGSLKDAIDLTGLFIEDGPVVQTKNHNNVVRVERDKNSKCLYKGPLLLLVSKLSASASEIFAGAMQDYNRAIIVGDKSTHGKGTVQTVFDLNNLITPYNFLDIKLGAIKLTNAMFYRVNGSSTQVRGVVPDITFNSLTDCLGIGEGELKHALPWDYIDPVTHKDYGEVNKYIDELNVKSIERRKNNSSFTKLDKVISMYNSLKNDKKVSLNKKKRLNKYKEEKRVLESQKEILNSTINKSDKKDEDKTPEDIFLNECVDIISDYAAFKSQVQLFNKI
jgi:carboxyl-terminal processing protease